MLTIGDHDVALLLSTVFVARSNLEVTARPSIEAFVTPFIVIVLAFIIAAQRFDFSSPISTVVRSLLIALVEKKKLPTMSIAKRTNLF